jgi:hypothetical protein
MERLIKHWLAEYKTVLIQVIVLGLCYYAWQSDFSFIRNHYFSIWRHGVYSSPFQTKQHFRLLSVGSDWHASSKLRQSARAWKLPLQIHGIGRAFPGMISKLRYLQEAISTLHDSDIIMVVDAYDVFVHAGEEKIIKAFKSMGKDLVFSAENWIFPDVEVGKIYPDIPQSILFRYVNSGGSVGYVKAYRQMLKDIMRDTMVDAMGKKHTVESDQRLFTKYFLQNPDKVTLDYQQKIFSNLNDLFDYRYFSFEKKGIYNHITNTTSLVFHGNGVTGKVYLEALYKEAKRQMHTAPRKHD